MSDVPEGADPPSIDVAVRRGGPAQVSTPVRIRRGAVRVVPQAILGALPVVGDAIAAVVSEVERQRSEESTNKLLRELSHMVRALENDKLDVAYLNSSDFLDRYVQAYRLSEQTRDDSKIRLYAAILAGSVSLDRTHFLEPESVLPVLAELSPADLAVLKDVWERGMHGAKAYTYKDASSGMPVWISANLVFHLLRLQRAGLVKEDTGTMFDYSGGNYSPTPTMHTLMTLVDKLDSPVATEGE